MQSVCLFCSSLLYTTKLFTYFSPFIRVLNLLLSVRRICYWRINLPYFLGLIIFDKFNQTNLFEFTIFVWLHYYLSINLWISKKKLLIGKIRNRFFSPLVKQIAILFVKFTFVFCLLSKFESVKIYWLSVKIDWFK